MRFLFCIVTNRNTFRGQTTITKLFPFGKTHPEAFTIHCHITLQANIFSEHGRVPSIMFLQYPAMLSVTLKNEMQFVQANPAYDDSAAIA